MKLLKRLALAHGMAINTTSSFENSTYPSIDSILAFLTGELKKLSLAIKQQQRSLQSKFQDQTNEKIAYPLKDHRNWAPIVKAKASALHQSANKSSDLDQPDLEGKSILCVGGQLKLYPQYSQFIESLGGRFISFHDNVNGSSLKHLLQLLQKADMIICPIDCVNHEAFLIVKQYCESFGKLCVLLDRSSVATFHQGIHALINIATETEVRFSYRSSSG